MSDQDDPRVIRQQERPLGRLLAEANGDPFNPLPSLDEAKADPAGVVILDGDWGGQVYVVCPARLIHCTMSTLRRLLVDLDQIAWPCNQGEGTGIYFQRLMIGSSVPGGMGGAQVRNTPWIHREFGSAIAHRVVEVLQGSRQPLR